MINERLWSMAKYCIVPHASVFKALYMSMHLEHGQAAGRLGQLAAGMLPKGAEIAVQYPTHEGGERRAYALPWAASTLGQRVNALVIESPWGTVRIERWISGWHLAARDNRGQERIMQLGKDDHYMNVHTGSVLTAACWCLEAAADGSWWSDNGVDFEAEGLVPVVRNIADEPGYDARYDTWRPAM